MIEIPLRRRDGTVRAVAVVDDEDAELARLRWSLGGNGYVLRREGRRFVYLHRAIMGHPEGLEVDHEDGDPLNCCRSNLRVATHQQNLQNRRSGYGRSKHRGVAWHPGNGMWMAQVNVRGKTTTRYAHDEDEAAELARELRRELLPFAVEDAA